MDYELVVYVTILSGLQRCVFLRIARLRKMRWEGSTQRKGYLAGDKSPWAITGRKGKFTPRLRGSCQTGDILYVVHNSITIQHYLSGAYWLRVKGTRR